MCVCVYVCDCVHLQTLYTCISTYAHVCLYTFACVPAELHGSTLIDAIIIVSDLGAVSRVSEECERVCAATS